MTKGSEARENGMFRGRLGPDQKSEGTSRIQANR